MRRTLALAFAGAVAAVTLGSFAPASAVCGGGAPGEPCYCPGPVKIKDREYQLIYCK